MELAIVLRTRGSITKQQRLPRRRRKVVVHTSAHVDSNGTTHKAVKEAVRIDWRVKEQFRPHILSTSWLSCWCWRQMMKHLTHSSVHCETLSISSEASNDYSFLFPKRKRVSFIFSKARSTTTWWRSCGESSWQGKIFLPFSAQCSTTWNMMRNSWRMCAVVFAFPIIPYFVILGGVCWWLWWINTKE